MEKYRNLQVTEGESMSNVVKRQNAILKIKEVSEVLAEVATRFRFPHMERCVQHFNVTCL